MGFHRKITAPAAVALMLLVAGCGSDATATTATTAKSGDSESTLATARPSEADSTDLLGQADFLVEANSICDESRKAFDALLAEGSDPAENPQPVVQGIADHFTALRDELGQLEGFDPEIKTATDDYLKAVKAAADEADEAASTEAKASEYLVAHSKALDEVNAAGKKLGVTSCQIEIAPVS